MHKVFEDFFDREKIYIRAEISAESLKIIQPHLMPENIKSAIVFLIPYYTGKHEDRNVSLYAVSRDYHFYARTLNERLCSLAKEHFPNEEFYGFCDSSPINDVAAAITAGLGVLGENHLLINKRYGSFVFIGSLLTTMTPENPVNIPMERCTGCGMCKKNCDFLGGRSDVCFSELNQRKQLTDEETSLVRSRKIRWGCDTCQDVCPMNDGIEKTPIDFFYEEQITLLTTEILENMPKDDFKKRAYAWRGKKTILRNIQDCDSSSESLRN